jgi:hypothetical protein
MTEKIIHKQVCQYIRMQYPEVLFNSDMAGAMKLTIGQAVQIKALRSNRGFPDITIYEPHNGFHGLFIELKKDGVKLYKKDGITPIDEHVAEQLHTIRLLTERLYYARICIGFDQAKFIIDEYLKP